MAEVVELVILTTGHDWLIFWRLWPLAWLRPKMRWIWREFSSVWIHCSSRQNSNFQILRDLRQHHFFVYVFAEKIGKIPSNLKIWQNSKSKILKFRQNWYWYLTCSRHMIKRTLSQLNMDSALVNIPVNISRIAPHQLNQPPWLVW